MNKKINTLDYIKRQAKKLKKELTINHTQALELTAKKFGYFNWIHCCRSFNRQPIDEIKPAKKELQLSFTDWVKKHRNRNSPLGDLGTEVLRDEKWPSYNTLEEHIVYLSSKNLPLGARGALERAWKSYKIYLRRKKRPNSNKPPTKNPTAKKRDPRKIVYVRNITPLRYDKRSVEKFNRGDSAWISWDGRKAIPVTIVKGDDRHYTIRIERPLKKAGGQNSLFLDEVRSTPELACINYVTF
jgi:hypothetical protein